MNSFNWRNRNLDMGQVYIVRVWNLLRGVDKKDNNGHLSPRVMDGEAKVKLWSNNISDVRPWPLMTMKSPDKCFLIVSSICIETAHALNTRVKWLPCKHALNKMVCALTHLSILLTYWSRDKIAAMSQTTFPNAFSWIVMAWYRPGKKPLSEPMMFNLLRPSASIS